jgi:phosphohistidine phosphatase SixA
MTSTPTAPFEPPRRRALWLLAAGVVPAWAVGQPADAPVDAATLAVLREGGVVLALRHALAPGTFDPPGFAIGQCGTQRNLSDEGRAQARRIGAWFQRVGLRPQRVRTSQWCRCQETARLAFGSADDWPMLNSLAREGPADAARNTALREALAAVPRGGFEVWVTHQFNIRALTGESTGSGDGVVLRGPRPAEPVQVVGAWRSV